MCVPSPLTHVAVGKEVFFGSPWLVLCPQPAAAAVVSEGKLETCHLLLY